MASSQSHGKPVCLIIGASRGIGRQVAVDLARNGYYVVVSAKTTSDASSIPPDQFPPDPNSSQSTIDTVAREIHEAGGHALAIACDVRNVEAIASLVDRTVQQLGQLDVLIYNSGAIWWSAVETTPFTRFRLMQQINPEGLYQAISCALPHFARRGHRGRIIVVSPPIYSRFFRGKTAYAMGKIGMSVLTKGLAMDFVRQKRTEMAITSLWPAVALISAATERSRLQNAANSSTSSSTLSSTSSPDEVESRKDLRHATIFSDTILEMLKSPAEKVNGLLDLDEDFLRRECGVTDFDKYSVVPGAKPRRMLPARFPSLEVEEQDDEGVRVDSAAAIDKRKAKI